MTKYDVIYESLQAKVESGELSLQEADELNQLAFEKYSDVEIYVEESEDDSITLEEAMDYISSVLMEDKSDISMKVDKDIEDQRIKSMMGHRDKEINKTLKTKGAKDFLAKNPATRKKISDARGKNDKKSFMIANNVNDEYKKKAQGKRFTFSAYRATDKKFDYVPELSITNGFVGLHDGIKKTKEQLQNKKKENSLPNRVKGILKSRKDKTVKESVDELRLQVYEAFEEGTITAEEKAVYLDYLNLENYQ